MYYRLIHKEEKIVEYKCNYEYICQKSVLTEGSCEQTAQKLAEKNIAVRAGFHCAYSAHKAFGTERFGTVRISPCIFNKMKDVNILLNYIFKFAK